MRETPLDKATFLGLSTVVGGMVMTEIAGVVFAFQHMEWGIISAIIVGLCAAVVGYLLDWRRQVGERDAH